MSATPQDEHDRHDFSRVARAEELLGFEFGDKELLRTALTHPSHLGGAHEHYERLEFLGDAVVGFLVSEHLFSNYPGLPEGRMTKVRSLFVSAKGLARAGDSIGLADVVIVGPGAESIRESHARSLMADAFEALIAAVYLDQGIGVARELLFRVVTPEIIEQAIEEALEEDPKSALQEHTQAVDGTLPEYRITQIDGPPHDRVFTAEVRVTGKVLGAGVGPSKQEAQRRAAAAALEALGPELGGPADGG